MIFESILFEKQEDRPTKKLELPSFFVDLNLDQIVDAATAGKQEYNLKNLFWSPLARLGAIHYRHEVMHDLESEYLFRCITAFADRMHAMRDYLARSERLYYDLQRQRWFLDAVEVYCAAVSQLSDDLNEAKLVSRGLQSFLEFLKGYASSERFQSLQEETLRLKADISAVHYCASIKGKKITVRKCEGELDYTAEVEKAFERFNRGEVRDYRAKFSEPSELNFLEAQVVETVAQLYPEVFADLGEYSRKHGDYLDEKIAAFDREIQFYVGYLAFINSIKPSGLEFCYPQVDSSKEVFDREAFDLALAKKLISENRAVICNDFSMSGKERILVVSGPNQGGKTTFARMFGQVHFLASLGLPVPGQEARLFLFDRLFTHFEKGENVEDLRSKLEDDLTRIREILSEATANSIVIANEILTSTTLNDAVFLGRKVMEGISHLDALCVWVTFVEELASYSEKTVSMIGTIDSQNPGLRTYKIVRKPAHGVSYASAMVEKYGLTYQSLKERVRP